MITQYSQLKLMIMMVAFYLRELILLLVEHQIIIIKN
jgi:hypothetical protein